MKRSSAVLVMLLGLTAIGFAQTVYIARGGKTFHVDGCPVFRKTKYKVAISLAQAKARHLIPCKVCKPLVKLAPPKKHKKPAKRKS